MNQGRRLLEKYQGAIVAKRIRLNGKKQIDDEA